MSEEVIKKFFIEDEKKFKEEDILRLIEKVGKYAKLIGKHGKVHIEKSFRGSGTEKLKLFLIVRYLGSELAKLKPELGIKTDIANITIDDVVDFLSLPDKHNARARMSALVKEDFAEKVRKGVIRVRPYQIERFIDSIEEDEKTTKKQEKAKNPIKRQRKSKSKEKVREEIDVGKIYDRLSKILGIDKTSLKDILIIQRDGFFKFTEMIGKSRREKQKNCIICTCYIVQEGFGKEGVNSRFIKEVCFNSDIEIEGLKFTLIDVKNSGYITKLKRGSEKNKLRDKGRTYAKKIFSELVGNKNVK